MNLRGVVDSSFLYNAFQMDLLLILCKVFQKLILVPSVLSECIRFQDQIDQLKCVEQVKLSSLEVEEVNKLHKSFVKSFPGKHYGEIESLVVANMRNEKLVISDNFAPWYIQKNNQEYKKVEIYRGWWIIGHLIENKELSLEILNKLEGRYPKKAIDNLRRNLEDE